MKRFSKLTALLLAALLLVSSAACGQKVPEVPEETPPAVETPNKEPNTPTDAPDEPVIQMDIPELGAKISELKSKNDDCVGWLKIPDTEIDAGVMYHENKEFYHRKNELKDYAWTGCYYADYECSFGATADDLMRSTVIYGHNVDTGSNIGTMAPDDADGQRFSQLFHFTDIEWAKEHPYIFFSTPEEDMMWEIFAVAYTTTDFQYIQVLKDRKVSSTEQITEAQMMKIVNAARERSEYDYPDVEVTGDDKILTLSTCSYKYGRRDDVRFIVMAKLVTEEDSLVERANIKINEDKKEVQ